MWSSFCSYNIKHSLSLAASLSYTQKRQSWILQGILQPFGNTKKCSQRCRRLPENLWLLVPEAPEENLFHKNVSNLFPAAWEVQKGEQTILNQLLLHKGQLETLSRQKQVPGLQLSF